MILIDKSFTNSYLALYLYDFIIATFLRISQNKTELQLPFSSPTELQFIFPILLIIRWYLCVWKYLHLIFQIDYRTRMFSISSFLVQTTLQVPKTPYKKVSIILTAASFSMDCEAYIEEKHVIFQYEGKTYLMNPQLRMEVAYNKQRKIQSLLINANPTPIKISSNQTNALLSVYQRLKRQISHNGFNDIFKPLKRLGRGSFATVYLIEHKITGEKFAAKVFSREIQKIGFMGHEALQNQIHMLRTLNHPNIIKFQGIYETDNLIYVLTEYLPGGTLAQFMRNKHGLLGDFITSIISDSLNALKYLEQKSIMHRDLKPQNIIMRQSDKKWVLADFGLAAFTNQKYLYDKCGTMGYIAPEILDQNKEEKLYSSSCDIYSLGVVAYHLIVGCMPYRVESEGMFEKKIIWDAFEKQESIGLDSEILRFLAGLLEKDPKKRLTPTKALASSFFSKEVLQSWKEFHKKKIQNSYSKILKQKNY